MKRIIVFIMAIIIMQGSTALTQSSANYGVNFVSNSGGYVDMTSTNYNSSAITGEYFMGLVNSTNYGGRYGLQYGNVTTVNVTVEAAAENLSFQIRTSYDSSSIFSVEADGDVNLTGNVYAVGLNASAGLYFICIDAAKMMIYASKNSCI